MILFYCRFLSLQDIPRNVDRAPSRTFFTFRADLRKSQKRLLGISFRAMNNLLARMAFETEKHSELLNRVHLVNQGRMDSSQLDPKALHVLKQTVRLVKSSLIQIDLQSVILQ